MLRKLFSYNMPAKAPSMMVLGCFAQILKSAFLAFIMLWVISSRWTFFFLFVNEILYPDFDNIFGQRENRKQISKIKLQKLSLMCKLNSNMHIAFQPMNLGIKNLIPYRLFVDFSFISTAVCE